MIWKCKVIDIEVVDHGLLSVPFVTFIYLLSILFITFHQVCLVGPLFYVCKIFLTWFTFPATAFKACFSTTSFLSCMDSSANLCKTSFFTGNQTNMSHVMRIPAFCICKNKDADQLRGYCEADQHLCFRYIDSTIPLLPKSEISSL